MNKNLKSILVAEGFDETRISKMSEIFNNLVEDAAEAKVIAAEDALAEAQGEFDADAIEVVKDEARQWVTENKLSIDDHLTVESAQSLIDTIASIAGKHEFVRGVVETDNELQDTIDELEVKFEAAISLGDTLIAKNIALTAALDMNENERTAFIEQIVDRHATSPESITAVVENLNSKHNIDRAKKSAMIAMSKVVREDKQETLLDFIKEHKDSSLTEFSVALSELGDALAANNKYVKPYDAEDDIVIETKTEFLNYTNEDEYEEKKTPATANTRYAEFLNKQ